MEGGQKEPVSLGKKIGIIFLSIALILIGILIVVFSIGYILNMLSGI